MWTSCRLLCCEALLLIHRGPSILHPDILQTPNICLGDSQPTPISAIGKATRLNSPIHQTHPCHVKGSNNQEADALSTITIANVVLPKGTIDYEEVAAEQQMQLFHLYFRRTAIYSYVSLFLVASPSSATSQQTVHTHTFPCLPLMILPGWPSSWH